MRTFFCIFIVFVIFLFVAFLRFALKQKNTWRLIHVFFWIMPLGLKFVSLCCDWMFIVIQFDNFPAQNRSESNIDHRQPWQASVCTQATDANGIRKISSGNALYLNRFLFWSYMLLFRFPNSLLNRILRVIRSCSLKSKINWMRTAWAITSYCSSCKNIANCCEDCISAVVKVKQDEHAECIGDVMLFSESLSKRWELQFY